MHSLYPRGSLKCVAGGWRLGEFRTAYTDGARLIPTRSLGVAGCLVVRPCPHEKRSARDVTVDTGTHPKLCKRFFRRLGIISGHLPSVLMEGARGGSHGHSCPATRSLAAHLRPCRWPCVHGAGC